MQGAEERSEPAHPALPNGELSYLEFAFGWVLNRVQNKFDPLLPRNSAPMTNETSARELAMRAGRCCGGILCDAYDPA
jgi:hypothetical protein